MEDMAGKPRDSLIIVYKYFTNPLFTFPESAMTQVLVEEEDQQQQELVEIELSDAVAAGGSQADQPQAPVPEQTYDSLFPALPMGSTKPGRPVAAVNNAPMVKVTSSRITQVRENLVCSPETLD